MSDLSEKAKSVLHDPQTRMDAYYYSFERTGTPSVDALLSAVAYAGRGSHHTEFWQEEREYEYGPVQVGESLIDVIQAAANDAAAEVESLRAKLAAVEALHIQGSLHVLDRGNVCTGCGGSWPCQTAAAIRSQEPPTPEDHAVCPHCNEHLGKARAENGYSAQWWADKMLREHVDERHD